MTVISATRSTSIENSCAFSGNTSRARKLPCGSCCQLTKCFCRPHFQRIAEDRRAAMRRRPQPHRLRRDDHRPVVLIFGLVIQRDANRHETALLKRLNPDCSSPTPARSVSEGACCGSTPSLTLRASFHTLIALRRAIPTSAICAQPMPTNRAIPPPILSKRHIIHVKWLVGPVEGKRRAFSNLPAMIRVPRQSLGTQDAVWDRS